MSRNKKYLDKVNHIINGYNINETFTDYHTNQIRLGYPNHSEEIFNKIEILIKSLRETEHYLPDEQFLKAVSLLEDIVGRKLKHTRRNIKNKQQ